MKLHFRVGTAHQSSQQLREQLVISSNMSLQSRQQKISTSTPKSSSKKSSKKAGGSSGDESSATLCSLLRVSPVGVKPSIPTKPGGRRKLKEKEELLINMVNQAKEREVCGKRNSGERGSMNSSVNTLSLQEVSSHM